MTDIAAKRIRELLVDVNEALSLGSYASSMHRALIAKIPALLDAADERDGFKQEIGYLRGEVDRLQTENERLFQKNSNLEDQLEMLLEAKVVLDEARAALEGKS